MQYETRNGWKIEFQKNVHMYYHSLKASKEGRTFDVPCEDTPGGFVIISTYQLSLQPAESSDLRAGLHEWADEPACTTGSTGPGKSTKPILALSAGLVERRRELPT